jgi:hypothetical protein
MIRFERRESIDCLSYNIAAIWHTSLSCSANTAEPVNLIPFDEKKHFIFRTGFRGYYNRVLKPHQLPNKHFTLAAIRTIWNSTASLALVFLPLQVLSNNTIRRIAIDEHLERLVISFSS